MEKTRIFAVFGVLLFLTLASAVTVFFARGYRIDFQKKGVTGTGIIAVSSIPSGALVYLNDIPTSATNTSITSLKPGTYKIRLEKEGFAAFQKEVLVEKEYVSLVDALLIRSVPELKPLTFTDAANPIISSDSQKIVFASTQNGVSGIWLLDLSERPFNLPQQPTLLLKDEISKKFSNQEILWSPDSKSLLIGNKYLFDLAGKSLTEETEITGLQSSWQKEKEIAKEKMLEAFSEEIKEKLASLKDASWSPDGTKVFYEKENVFFVFDLKPKDLRKKETQEYEAYQKKEGKFSKVFWYPDSQHLLILEKDSIENQEGTIKITEIDGENEMQIFSGTIVSDYLFSYTNGSKIVVLTTFNPESKQHNLYSINLR